MAAEPYPNLSEGASSERSIMAWVGLASAVIIATLCVWAAKFSTPPNLGAPGTPGAAGIDGGAASMLAMVSIVAVGIERLIEIFWSMIGSFKNGWWPLPEIADAVEDLANETNRAAQPAFAAAIAGLEEIRNGVDVAEETRKALEDEINRVKADEEAFKKQIQQIASLSKNNQRVQLIATTTFQAVNRLDAAYGRVNADVRKAFNDASQVTAGVSDLLAGFKDNPAKKIISIILGAIAGLLISGVVGLDLFAAAGMPLGDRASMFPYVGVMLTGLVVGLGANPTHEVVRWVTESAKSRRAANLGRPNVSGSPDERDEVASGTSIARRAPGTMNLK